MIHLSQAAISEIQRIRAKQPDPEAMFRLSVHLGGCADFYYILNFDTSVAADDHCLNCNGIQVIVDAESWQYLDGLGLDYSEDLMGGGFRFDNPHAVSSCGCGNSFAVSKPSV
jgi:iron-sulfur cluster assembly accessory protein